jgi:hypothetical protein
MLLLISGVSAGGLRATAPGYDSSASGLHIHGWKTRTERFWCRTIGTSVLKQPDVNYCTGGISFSRELEQHNIFLIYGGAATALGMVSHNAFCLIRSNFNELSLGYLIPIDLIFSDVLSIHLSPRFFNHTPRQL